MRLCLVVVVLLLSGCTTSSFWRRAKAVVRTPSSQITQSGDVAVPTQVHTTTTKTEVPIPAGSRITVETPAPTAATVSLPSPVLSQSVTTESITGPSSFTPPVGPTPSEQSAGTVKLYSWFGVIIGAMAAIFGLVRGWNMVMYGGIAIAGACLLAIFVQAYPWLFAIIGLGAGIAYAGPYIWHTKLKPTVPPNGTAT